MDASVKRLLEVEQQVSKVIVGKNATIRLAVAAMAAGGHVLLEDVPGTGKTVFAKALAKSVSAGYNRIQFTPDLLPTDITGLSVYRQDKGDFEFKPGPVFTNILLADEINRATPRTQSGLLECMEERQVTADGVTRPLAEPFFVIATQNPVETSGTFPLPEAQLDRFLMKLSMGFPDKTEEVAILNRYLSDRTSTTWGGRKELQTASQFSDVKSVTPDGIEVCAALLDRSGYDAVSNDSSKAVEFIYKDNPLVVIAARTLGLPLSIHLYDMTRFGTKTVFTINPEAL